MKLRARYELGALLINAAGLALVRIALASGAPRERWGPTAVFLSIGAVAALIAEVVHHLTRLRARRQSIAEVPRGVLLRKPLWLSLDEPLAFIDFGAPLAAVASAFGFSGVGVGIMLTVCTLMVFMRIMDVWLSTRDLTLEPDGLRVHLRAATFFVPWKSIAAVEREGPRQRELTNLDLLETKSVIESVQPDTARNRRRVQIATYDGDRAGGKLMLLGWSGGLDAPALARSIRAEIDSRRGGRLN